jgi:hypothetical protein
VILPDTNLLLYATDAASPFHKKARSWWEGCLTARTTVGFARPAIFAFIRLSTHPAVFERPLAVEEAFAHLENWEAFAVVEWLEPDADHAKRVKRLLMEAGTGGNLVSDAQLAAYALQYDATVFSADLDFARFSGVKWKNPV